jgi:hypothetical protein
MKYTFRASPDFWKSFYALSPAQKARTRAAWLIFKQDPFDPRLRTHKIHRLSAAVKRTVHAITIEGDLRAVFYIEDNVVFTFAIGTHDIYKR